MRYAIMTTFLLFGAPAFAQSQSACSEQLARTVEALLPPGLDRSLDVRELSCANLSLVYGIVQDRSRGFGGPVTASYQQRQRIEAVIRREGLLQ